MAPHDTPDSADRYRSSSWPAAARRVAVALVALAVAVVGLPAASGADGSIAEQLAAAQDEATSLAAELAAIETDLAELEEAIEAHDAEIAEVRAELEGLVEEVREIAVARYMSAANGPITYSDDLHEHQRIDVMMSAVQRDSEATMAAYEDARERLDRASRDLANRIEEQDEARERLADRLSDLEVELARLAELQRQAEIEAARVEAERREAERREAERREAEMAAAATTTTTTTEAPAPTPADSGDGNPTTTPPPTTAPPTTAPPTTSPPPTTTTPPSNPPPSSGSFRCPVQGTSVFIDSWGAPRSGGRSHMGVDMLASIGTPAVAPVSGTVTHRWNDVGGHSYHLNGDDGNYYYGTHLSAYGASGRVTAGTVIGYVGDTGNAAGIPHLHFEIHIGGRGNPINPYPTVRAAC